MKSSDQRMIDTQAKLISRLNEDLKKQRDELSAKISSLRQENDRMREAYRYYMTIQEAALADENVMSQFQTLLMMIKLSSEDEIPGLTARD